MGPVAVADSKSPAVRAERERTHRTDDRAEVADLAFGFEAWPNLAQRVRVEERHAAVVAADGNCSAVAAEHVVEDARAAAVQRSERCRAPQQRGEEIAARCHRIVEVHALTRQQ